MIRPRRSLSEGSKGYSLKLRSPKGWVDDPYSASPGSSPQLSPRRSVSEVASPGPHHRRLSIDQQLGEVETDVSAAAAAPAAAREQHWRAYRALARMALGRSARNLSAHPAIPSLCRLESLRRMRAAARLVERSALFMTPPHLPAWCLLGLRLRLRSPQHSLSSLEARRDLRRAPRLAPKLVSSPLHLAGHGGQGSWLSGGGGADGVARQCERRP